MLSYTHIRYVLCTFLKNSFQPVAYYVLCVLKKLQINNNDYYYIPVKNKHLSNLDRILNVNHWNADIQNHNKDILRWKFSSVKEEMWISSEWSHLLLQLQLPLHASGPHSIPHFWSVNFFSGYDSLKVNSFRCLFF